jgi:hypothetical protein
MKPKLFLPFFHYQKQVWAWDFPFAPCQSFGGTVLPARAEPGAVFPAHVGPGLHPHQFMREAK